MGEKEQENENVIDCVVDWESQCKHYKKMYYELDQSYQSDKEKLLDDFFKKDELIDKLQNEISVYRNIIMKLSTLLANKQRE